MATTAHTTHSAHRIAPCGSHHPRVLQGTRRARAATSLAAFSSQGCLKSSAHSAVPNSWRRRYGGGSESLSQCSKRQRAVDTTTTTTTTNYEGVPTVTDLSGLGAVENQVGMTYRSLDALPTRKEVLAAIPAHCFKKNTAKSLLYAFTSTALTAACGVLGYLFIPLQAAYWPAWVAYAIVTGTVATGAWVVAHECGHGAFSDNRRLQDAVGYALHSALLVPYFSWQRSHAIHHANTNHLEEGETHVPAVAGDPKGDGGLIAKSKIGELPWTVLNSIIVLLFGWPAYLIAGASGGPVRGATNHFWPWAGEQGRHSLFPGGWKKKVLMSDVGVFAVIGLLAYWAYAAGSIMPALALYVGPYLVTNAWLVGYTWLQHTDVDIAQYTGSDWNWVRGAFLTVDRPYGPVFDFLHHRIGSTHVAHHVDHTIPHYNAVEATEALKKAFPHLYMYDPTPVHQALFRVASKCIAVKPSGKGGQYVFTDQPLAA